ncbi:MAG: ribonuclease HII [Acidobacteriaceae bacterium]|nr:ribonuclease HII [Acidobacteriaceae bacterium]
MEATARVDSRRRKPSVDGGQRRCIRCVSTFEREARERGFSRIAGIDEVGRGCLFGPVFAAAVVTDPARPIRGLRDSKTIVQEEREALAEEIKARCISWAVGGADVFEIDQINIYQASRLAMRRAVEALTVQPDYLLIDALRLDLPIEQLPLIDGDARCRAIAAASILAKVHRDTVLARWHEVFPQYNLAANKGYATPDHRRALRQYGPTLMHRFSFEPVRLASSNVHWSGYITEGPAQESLFGSSDEAEAEECAQNGLAI